MLSQKSTKDRIRALSMSSVLFVALLTPFQNCGRQFLVQSEINDFSSLSTCDNNKFEIFEQGFYPFFRSHCSSCHVDGGPGIGKFADSDLQMAWRQFNSMGVNAIVRNALNDNHKPPHTGQKHKPVLDPLVQRWQEAELAKLACESEGLKEDPFKLPVRTKPVIIRNITDQFQKVSWNLETDLEQTVQNGLIRGELELEWRIVIDRVFQIQIRNPRIRMQGDKALFFNHLYIVTQGQRLNDLTRYTQLNKTVAPGDWVNLIDNSLAMSALQEFQLPLQLAVELHGVQLVSTDGQPNPSRPDNPTTPTTPTTPVTPSQVTYQDLMGNNSNLNVFAQSCVRCHNNNSALGGLNLQNATQARPLSSTILSRMRSTTRPMPPSGLLPSNRVQLVETWVRNGSP